MHPRIIIFICSALVVVSINNAGAQTCPMLEPTDWSAVFQEIGSITPSWNYNISELKYFVMTPSSYPQFANPDGEVYNWSGTECAGKEILFNCHGWQTRGNETWTYDLLGTFVKEYGGCGVASDYSGATLNFNYLEAASEVHNIATGLSAYINDNICQVNDCQKLLKLHGHSLGAHPCGVTGYLLKQKGIVVSRMIASDAAGPLFNLLDVNDSSLHLTKQSAATVINLKTSWLQGSSLAGWVHQQQIIGSCGFEQNQCPLFNQDCSHRISPYITRSTMEPNFPDIKLNQLDSSTPYNCYFPTYASPAVVDSLGWKSEGKPGEFKTGSLGDCLDLSHVTSTRKINHNNKRASRKTVTHITKNKSRTHLKKH